MMTYSLKSRKSVLAKRVRHRIGVWEKSITVSSGDQSLSKMNDLDERFANTYCMYLLNDSLISYIIF